MSNKIDNIIENLNQLKLKNIKKEDEISKMIKEFEDEKRQIDHLTKSLVGNISSILNDLSIVCQSKIGFIEKIKINKGNEFKDKPYRLYYVRESILSEMFRNDSYKTLYNIFFSFMIVLMGNFFLENISKMRRFSILNY